MMQLKCLICQQIWKTKQWPPDRKWPVFIPIPKKGNDKDCSNCFTIALISHGSKVTLKILYGRLQRYVKSKLPQVQVWFRQVRGTRDQIANIRWIIKTARKYQKKKKNLLLLYWLCQSFWLCGSQKTEKFFKSWEYKTTWIASWEISIQVKKQ